MSKRKRERTDEAVSPERHKKVRVQEVEIAAPSEKTGLRKTAGDVEIAQESSNLGDEEVARRADRKKAKQERRDLKKAQKDAKEVANGVLTKNKIEGPSSSRIIEKTKKGKKDKGKRAGGENAPAFTPGWKTSEPVGGQMLDLDPVYSLDEEHLLVAYGTSVAVYSTSTSLLVRRLRVPRAGIITGLALDPSDQDHVYITTASRDIERWNWKQGSRPNTWTISSDIYALTAAHQTQDGKLNDLVYTIDKKEGGQWLLSAHRLGVASNKTEVKTLLKYDDRLSAFKVLEGGKVIVATSGYQLIIGTTDLSIPAKLSDVKYVWRIVNCPEWIASFDVRSRPSERTSKKHEKGGALLEAIDVAVGGLKGTIHVYEDLCQKVLRKERAGKAGNLEDIVSRSLHWHRNSVSTVKWSLDGNYVISGGQETVLVLWQLETGQKQDLPHLGAPIESIVVSPAGSSYSVRLADNSVMILSTSELRPTFSVAGTQLPAGIKQRGTLPFVPTVDVPRESAAPSRRFRYPACVACPGTDRLLLAVPPSTVSSQTSGVSQNASYLQTCDINSGHQLSRQALTRTKITTLTMGPESNTIEEPDVTHMQISHDGQWLATVDEWTPPQRDLAPLAFDDGEIKGQKIVRREIYLKFWSWNSGDQVWELVSRIDNPYASDWANPFSSNRILDLASDPSTAGFSTISEDGVVKTWKPSVRKRRGLKVKGRDGASLITWRNQHTIPTGTPPPTSSLGNSSSAKVAYSPDGSLLAVAPQSSSLTSPIYLISTATGAIQTTLPPSLSPTPLSAIGIISKYLILLSLTTLTLYDLVNNIPFYVLDLHPSNSHPNLQQTTLLAINKKHDSFALALPTPTPSGRPRTKLAIFNPSVPEPLFTTTVQANITHLLPAIATKGFYTIDSNVEIRSVLAQHAVPTGLPTPPRDTDVGAKGIDGIFGDGEKKKKNGVGGLEGREGKGLLTMQGSDHLTRIVSEEAAVDADAVVVSQDRLAAVFDTGSALAMPPIGELFERVARLYGGRVD